AVRCVDINPLQPLGIDATQIRFLDAFLRSRILNNSPTTDDRGNTKGKANLRNVVNEGRRPGLTLARNSAPIAIRDWANEILDQIAPIAALLDQTHTGDAHDRSLAQQRAKIADSDLTPSAQILAEMHATRSSWSRLALDYSQRHAAD